MLAGPDLEHFVLVNLLVEPVDGLEENDGFSCILKSREAWIYHLTSGSVGNAKDGIVMKDNIVDGLSIPVDDG